MPVKVKNIDELRSVIRGVRVVLVMYYDSSRPGSRYVEELAESLSYSLEPSITIVLADTKVIKGVEELGVKSTPRLQLYLDGKIIWEQLGLLNNILADKEAIRFGIRESIKRQGYRLRDLGIIMRF